MSRIGLVYLRPHPVVFFREEGPYGRTVRAAWARMLGWLDKHELRAGLERGYGLMRDDPRVIDERRCRYDACVELRPEMDSRILEGAATQRLPGGAYARQRVAGTCADLSRAVVEMRDQWAAAEGVVIDARRPIVTIYLADPGRSDTHPLKADVCMPISAAADLGNRSAA